MCYLLDITGCTKVIVTAERESSVCKYRPAFQDRQIWDGPGLMELFKRTRLSQTGLREHYALEDPGVLLVGGAGYSQRGTIPRKSQILGPLNREYPSMCKFYHRSHTTHKPRFGISSNS